MSVSDVVPKTLRLGRWDIVGFDNFSRVVSRPFFSKALTNTVIYTLIVLTLSLWSAS
jgi:ABC-type sugar transport system permease subunit